MTAAQIRMIHVAARDLGMDQDTRHDLQLMVTGKASLSDMSDAELEQVVRAMKDRGFQAGKGRGRKGRPAAKRGDIRFCHVLWGKLAKAGAVDTAGPRGLNQFIRSRFGKAWGAEILDIDQVQDWRQIASVIEALKAMCDRAGIPL